jgi:two-component system OmpR family sensor kinase
MWVSREEERPKVRTDRRFVSPLGSRRGKLTVPVSNDRLTRHEITWLLAQEARGAAKALRSELHVPRIDVRPTGAPVETTLDALDDTIDMLSQLNSGARGKGRRGRIDLAALLYEVAPAARLSIEPGAGTEVFGEESELRRMLNLLVTQASASAGAGSTAETVVTIRRQGDLVRISVELGPDTSATGELERRWLSRMALRHGGRVELEGGTQSIYVQADGASDQREVNELRKELEQAQQLGEAYARELATVLATGDVRTEPPPMPAADEHERFEGVRSAAAAFHRVLKGWVEGLRNDLAALPASNEAVQALTLRTQSAQELLSELQTLGECPLDEPKQSIDLVPILKEALARVEARAEREGVECSSSLPSSLMVTGQKRLLELLLDSALGHAVAATQKGGSVVVSCFGSELGPVVTVADGGPVVPESLRGEVARHRVDPTTLGRPAGISLVAADATARALGATLELREGVEGRQELWIALKSRRSIPVRA